MKTLLAILGWTLRASAAICITWIVVQAFQGKIDALPALLSSVVWHAAFALSGVALVGESRKGALAVDPTPSRAAGR